MPECRIELHRDGVHPGGLVWAHSIQVRLQFPRGEGTATYKLGSMRPVQRGPRWSSRRLSPGVTVERARCDASRVKKYREVASPFTTSEP